MSDNVLPFESKGPGHGGPARGYTWEPFQPGHFKALKHGAHSPRIIVPMAAEIANDLMQRHERLRDPLYREQLLEYSKLMAQVNRFEVYLDKVGEIFESGEKAGQVRPAAEYLLKARKQASNIADRLGLTPLANARLGKDTASAQADLVAVYAQMLAEQKDNNDDSA